MASEVDAEGFNEGKGQMVIILKRRALKLKGLRICRVARECTGELGTVNGDTPDRIAKCYAKLLPV
jgi:hypothetical protein